jgi:hypothetical protein
MKQASSLTVLTALATFCLPLSQSQAGSYPGVDRQGYRTAKLPMFECARMAMDFSAHIFGGGASCSHLADIAGPARPAVGQMAGKIGLMRNKAAELGRGVRRERKGRRG